MDRQTILAVVIAIVGIMAVSLSAATLTTTVAPDSSIGTGSGESDGEEVGMDVALESHEPPVDTIQIPYLQELITLLLIVGILVLLGYLFTYHREALPDLFRIVAFMGLFALLLYLLLGVYTPTELSVPTSTSESLDRSSGNGDDGGGELSPTELLTIGLLIAALLGTIVLFLQSKGIRSLVLNRNPESKSLQHNPDTAAIGRAAGRVADRIEEGEEFDNDVYRAWAEMTDRLDVSDPNTTTPGEFAFVAVDSGIDRKDVTELTQLFEDVRYGGRRPTPDQEQRAIRVLRRIESTYAATKS